jgi:hypothetical protein
VAQLADILIEKIEQVGGKAALGRMLGGLPGQLIFQYTKGVMPSIDFAIKWKEAFDENLIDLLFEDHTGGVSEPTVSYGNAGLIAELNDVRKELIECMKERDELKKFLPVGGEAKLKKQPE